MINNKNKRNRKIFVGETIGTRKYFSYRADLLLYKVMLCIFVYIIIYMITYEIIISLLISVQVLLIFTLINKLTIERKEKEGKEILLKKAKLEYFKKKLNELDIVGFEKLVKYYFEKQGYINYIKIGKFLYSMEKSSEIFYVKIFKLYDGVEIERIDIRGYITFMSQNKIKNGFIVSANEFNDEAAKFIDKMKNDFKLDIIKIDNLFIMAEEWKLLPDDSFFYKKIETEKNKNNSTKMKEITNNTFNNKKIIIYLLSSAFFYILSLAMPNNNLTLYISYYFVLLTLVSTAYITITKIINNKVID